MTEMEDAVRNARAEMALGGAPSSAEGVELSTMDRLNRLVREVVDARHSLHLRGCFGLTVHLSLVDALAYQAARSDPDTFDVTVLCTDGSTGTFMGMSCVARANLAPGEFYIGHRGLVS